MFSKKRLCFFTKPLFNSKTIRNTRDGMENGALRPLNKKQSPHKTVRKTCFRRIDMISQKTNAATVPDIKFHTQQISNVYYRNYF